MPGVINYRDATNDPEGREHLQDERPELTKLWLPSAIPADVRSSYCFPGVLDIYLRYRQAQVHDALVQLRQARRMVKGVNDKFKYQVAGTGQRAMTRARTIIANASKRADKVAKRYCAARTALLSLDPTGSWRKKYRNLNLQTDVRGPGRDPQEMLAGDGDHTPSWIWLIMLGKNFQDSLPLDDPQLDPQRVDSLPTGSRQSTGRRTPLADSSAQINETLRVEWSRLTARADRWTEEHELLIEEMQRTLAFLQWKSSDWNSRALLRVATVPPHVQAGLTAYAAKQASLFCELAISFASQWHPVLLKNGIKHDWFDSTGALCNLYSRFNPSPEPLASPQHPSPSTDHPNPQELDDDGDDDVAEEDVDEDEDLDWEDEEDEENIDSDEGDLDDD
jgi:hypothetical protein